MKHWQRNASRSRLAVWAGVQWGCWMLGFRVAITRVSATVSLEVGPFYCGAGVP